MAPVKLLLLLLIKMERTKRRNLRQRIVALVVQRKRFLLRCSLILSFLIQCYETVESSRTRSCRRYRRNMGFWEMAWKTYNDSRFKKTFRVSRRTFEYILQNIRHDILKEVVTELPISPECRLAICLYRLGRGDYLYTIAELFGRGVATVHRVVEEVCDAIIKNLWKESVQSISQQMNRSSLKQWSTWKTCGNSPVVGVLWMAATFLFSALQEVYMLVRSIITSRIFSQ